jgi:hypothetical protein
MNLKNAITGVNSVEAMTTTPYQAIYYPPIVEITYSPELIQVE